MNRYQFEVLAFLEKNGKNVYAIRTLSDKLKISGTEVSKALDELTNIGAILRDENLLEITAKGLDMLEPYRVKGGYNGCWFWFKNGSGNTGQAKTNG